MNRRDFAKGLAALPFIGSVKSFASICNSDCPSDPNSLWVVLEGPFAIVIDSTTHAIQAFSPKHNGEHMLAFNEIVCDNTPQYIFQMTLSSTPSSPPPLLCVQNKFPQFCAENTHFDSSSIKDSFLIINLPVPQRIIAYDLGYRADMQDNTKAVPVPSIHIMEYDLNGNVPNMTGSYGNTTLNLQPMRSQIFRFELGLPELLGGGDSDNTGIHAKDFHNSSLLPHFSQLASDKGRNIDRIYKGARTQVRPHVIHAHQHKAAGSKEPSRSAAKRDSKLIRAKREHILTTTTFECKAGGLLVTSP